MDRRAGRCQDLLRHRDRSAVAEHSDQPPDLPDLDRLDPERQQEVRAWLSESLADCPVCGHPVFRVSPRALDGNSGELGHLDCMSEPLGRCAACGMDISRKDKREQAKAGLFHAGCAPAKR